MGIDLIPESLKQQYREKGRKSISLSEAVKDAVRSQYVIRKQPGEIPELRDRDLLERLIDQGMTNIQMAKYFGCSAGRVRFWTAKFKLRARNPKTSKCPKEYIEKTHDDGQ